MMATIFNSMLDVILDWAVLNKKKLHSFILTQLHDGSHLQFLPSWIQPLGKKTLHSFILT